MKIIGLIMEVNPFHNGHIYFLKEVKNKNPEDMIIVLISTTIVQRGEVTVLDKEIKTQLLLDYADLVIEMPLIFSNQGGEYFGYWAVKILNDLNVNKIVFGSESADIDSLHNSLFKSTQNKDFENGYLKNEIKNLKSNDILGISYIKAINKINDNIEVQLIKRQKNEYNDENLSNIIASATAIRNNYNKYSYEQMLNYLPKKSLENMHEFNQRVLFDILKVKLLDIDDETIFLSEQGQLISKIRKNIKDEQVDSLTKLATVCSDKNNSKYKFQRLFINIILNVNSNFINNNLNNNKYKVLGFNKNIQKYLKNNENLFLSYKDININNSIYKYNQKADELLSIFLKKDLNKVNYQKPIIKDGNES